MAKLIEGAMEAEVFESACLTGVSSQEMEEFNFLVATTRAVLRAHRDFDKNISSALSKVCCMSGIGDFFGGCRETSVASNSSGAGIPTNHIHVTTLISGTLRDDPSPAGRHWRRSMEGLWSAFLGPSPIRSAFFSGRSSCAFDLAGMRIIVFNNV